MAKTAYELGCVLDGVFDVLDDKLGDTDPYVPEGITEDERPVSCPVHWLVICVFCQSSDSIPMTKCGGTSETRFIHRTD